MTKPLTHEDVIRDSINRHLTNHHKQDDGHDIDLIYSASARVAGMIEIAFITGNLTAALYQELSYLVMEERQKAVNVVIYGRAIL